MLTCLALSAYCSVSLAITFTSWCMARSRLLRQPMPPEPQAVLTNDEVEILCTLLEEAVGDAEERRAGRLELAVLGDLLHRLLPLTPSRYLDPLASTLPRSIRLGKKRDAAPHLDARR